MGIPLIPSGFISTLASPVSFLTPASGLPYCSSVTAAGLRTFLQLRTLLPHRRLLLVFTEMPPFHEVAPHLNFCHVNTVLLSIYYKINLNIYIYLSLHYFFLSPPQQEYKYHEGRIFVSFVHCCISSNIENKARNIVCLQQIFIE